jgi:hypothetical protein
MNSKTLEGLLEQVFHDAVREKTAAFDAWMAEHALGTREKSRVQDFDEWWAKYTSEAKHG